jgi:hypothetical protein
MPGSSRSVSQPGTDLEGFQNTLHRALAQTKAITDLAARMPGCFQLEDDLLVFGQQAAEAIKRLMGLGELARCIAPGKTVFLVTMGLERFLSLQVLLLGRRSAIFIDDFVPRCPREKCEQILFLVEVVGTGPDLEEKAPPHALKEVERIEPRPQ